MFQIATGTNPGQNLYLATPTGWGYTTLDICPSGTIVSPCLFLDTTTAPLYTLRVRIPAASGGTQVFGEIVAVSGGPSSGFMLIAGGSGTVSVSNVRIYRNGLRLHQVADATQPGDYFLTGRTVTFINNASGDARPVGGDILTVDYTWN